jgi:hypothetical protein
LIIGKYDSNFSREIKERLLERRGWLVTRFAGFRLQVPEAQLTGPGGLPVGQVTAKVVADTGKVHAAPRGHDGEVPEHVTQLFDDVWRVSNVGRAIIAFS